MHLHICFMTARICLYVHISREPPGMVSIIQILIFRDIFVHLHICFYDLDAYISIPCVWGRWIDDYNFGFL